MPQDLPASADDAVDAAAAATPVVEAAEADPKLQTCAEFLRTCGLPEDAVTTYGRALVDAGFDSRVILENHMDAEALRLCGITKLGHVRAILNFCTHQAASAAAARGSTAAAAAAFAEPREPTPPASAPQRNDRAARKTPPAAAKPAAAPIAKPAAPIAKPAPPRKRIAVHAASFAEARGDMIDEEPPAASSSSQQQQQHQAGQTLAWRERPEIREAIARARQRARSGALVDEATGRPMLLKVFMATRGDTRFRSVRVVPKSAKRFSYEARIGGETTGRPSIGSFETELEAAVVLSLLMYEPVIVRVMGGPSIEALVEEAVTAFTHPGVLTKSTSTVAWVELIAEPPYAKAVDPEEKRIY